MANILRLTLLIILCLWSITLTLTVRQEFTFYDRFRHEAEDSITLTRHYPNITGNWDFFLKLAQGRCVQGEYLVTLMCKYKSWNKVSKLLVEYGPENGVYVLIWATYLGENYRDMYFRMISCSDHAEGYFGNVKSLRYLGASDTATPAISFYEGIFFEGQEHFFQDTSSETGPEFTVNSLATTGSTNWALYEGANFTGRRVFIGSGTGEVFVVPRTMTEFGIGNVRSFMRVDL